MNARTILLGARAVRITKPTPQSSHRHWPIGSRAPDYGNVQLRSDAAQKFFQIKIYAAEQDANRTFLQVTLGKSHIRKFKACFIPFIDVFAVSNG